MKIDFIGDISDLNKGIGTLQVLLGFERSLDGLPVEIHRESGNIKVEVRNGKGLICYEKKIHFFRALGLLIEGLQNNKELVISEVPQFSMNGVMFDCSRNAVLTVDSVKKMVNSMALMGLDTIMLYTEDTYTIKDEPYFGYMRGRYSQEELRECDDYADQFGIEVIPCIQTLAHLEQFLKWWPADQYKDSNDTLLAGNEKVYELIEKMIASAAASFRSRRIHIGMDEAVNMCRGRYLDQNGYCDRFKVFMQHLTRVLEITEKYGFKPMIWSDMFFRLASEKHDYYDLDVVVPKEIIDAVPEEIELVAWDYYHSEQGFYERFLQSHKLFKSKTIFAGGVWTWTGGYGTNYGTTFVNTNAALAACKKEGIREVLATLWLDDGGEDNFFTALLGLQLFAEHGYAVEVDEDKLKRRVEFCTGMDYDAFTSLKFIDETPGAISDNLDYSNPSKFLLFQDILIGLFDRHAEGLDLPAYYARLAERFREYKKRDDLHEFIFDLPVKLCSALEIKSDIGIRIKQAYDNKDFNTLVCIAEVQLPELYQRVEAVRKAHRQQWLKTYKPFGWEVMDIRYGGVLTRIDTAMLRIQDYIRGGIGSIEELEEERLYFDGCVRPAADKGLGVFNNYKRIATANII